MTSVKEGDSAAEGPKSSWLVDHGLIPETRPKRLIAFLSFVNTLGSGMFVISAALFYTKSVGLSVPQVGLGMGIGALVGLTAGVPVGHLADRRGPREVFRLTLLAQALAMASLVFVHSFLFFVLVVSLTELATSASVAARGPLVRGLGGPNLTKYRSYIRVVINLAMSVAGVAAGFAIQLNTRHAYLALVLGNALSFALCALIVNWLPSLPPVKKPPGSSRWVALKDKAYLTVSLLDGIMWIQGMVLIFALPLWIVSHTHAPRWFVGAAMMLNTAMVVTLQVRASRGIETTASAARSIRRSGAAFLIGMALIAAAAGMPAWLAVTVLVAGVGVHTIGELWHAAGSLELQIDLAPAHAQGQYTGIFQISRGLANVIAPSLLGLLCITWGPPGWLAMGGIFVAIGLAMPSAIRWADRTRPELETAD